MKKSGALTPADAAILVAEDHPLNQMFVRKALQRFGVGRFEVVSNGAEAFRMFGEAHWDLILMDCHMPEMDGYETTKAIREAEKKTGAHAVIIAMTATTTAGEREKCLAIGMDEYISKPINVSELKYLLANWLKFDDDMGGVSGPKPAWNNQTPVDISVLQAVDKDPAAQKEMVRAFILQSDQNMALLRQAAGPKKSARTVKETAHMFKGGSASLGAAALSQMCDRLEVFEGTDGGRMALVEAIGKEYGQVRHYLEELGLLERKD